MSQPSLTGFDWEALDHDTRHIVRATTTRLHELERRTGEAVIEIGKGLADTKGRIGDGLFESWLRSEFDWSRTTAYRFIQVADRFGGMSQIGTLAPSALYALASGNVPEPIREEFMQRAEAGETIRHKDVKQRLATVDLDSGEILDEPEIEYEEVDPSDPASFLPRPTPIHHPSAALSKNEQAYGDSGMQELAPNAIARKLNDVSSLVARARVSWRYFSAETLVAHGDTQHARDSLETIITTSQELLNSATEVRDQLSAGKRLRAIR